MPWEGMSPEDALRRLLVVTTLPDTVLKQCNHRTCLLVHPDKIKHPQTSVAFQRLNSAWEVLRDHAKRAEYNNRLVNAAMENQEAEQRQYKRRQEAERLRKEMDRKTTQEAAKKAAAQAKKDSKRAKDETNKGKAALPSTSSCAEDAAPASSSGSEQTKKGLGDIVNFAKHVRVTFEGNSRKFAADDWHSMEAASKLAHAFSVKLNSLIASMRVDGKTRAAREAFLKTHDVRVKLRASLTAMETEFVKSIFANKVADMEADLRRVFRVHLGGQDVPSAAACSDRLTFDPESMVFTATVAVGLEKVSKEFKTRSDANHWLDIMETLGTQNKLKGKLAYVRKAAATRKATHETYDVIVNLQNAAEAETNPVYAKPSGEGLDSFAAMFSRFVPGPKPEEMMPESDVHVAKGIFQEAVYMGSRTPFLAAVSGVEHKGVWRGNRLSVLSDSEAGRPVPDTKLHLYATLS